jgi:hypothetical protein
MEESLQFRISLMSSVFYTLPCSVVKKSPTICMHLGVDTSGKFYSQRLIMKLPDVIIIGIGCGGLNASQNLTTPGWNHLLE